MQEKKKKWKKSAEDQEAAVQQKFAREWEELSACQEDWETEKEARKDSENKWNDEFKKTLQKPFDKRAREQARQKSIEVAREVQNYQLLMRK